jgi:hypothetical protein
MCCSFLISENYIIYVSEKLVADFFTKPFLAEKSAINTRTHVWAISVPPGLVNVQVLWSDGRSRQTQYLPVCRKQDCGAP